MQETVTNTNNNDNKSLFSTYLEVLEAREQQLEAERRLQEERYLSRVQRIYDYHDAMTDLDQIKEQTVNFEAQLSLALEASSGLEAAAGRAEAALRTGGGAGLAGALLRHAAALPRRIRACLAHSSAVRNALCPRRQPQMDALLDRMERELAAWTAFLQRAADAVAAGEGIADNLRNVIAEQSAAAAAVRAALQPAAACSTPLKDH